MPAPKKPQEAKDQTRRRQGVRKYRKACRKYLGPLGMYLFREFLNLHGRLPIETTAWWAEALAQVFGDKGSAVQARGRASGKVQASDLNDHRGQFGGWTQALLHRRLDLPHPHGLCFTLRIIEVQGTRPDRWRGLVLLIYERQCGVLFHHLMRMGGQRPPNGDTVWRALDQAVLRLITGRWPLIQREALTSTPATVALPIDSKGRWSHPIFAEAARLSRKGTASTLPHQSTVVGWAVTTFKGLRTVRHSVDPYTLPELERMLRQEAKSVSGALKAFRAPEKRASPKNAGGGERPLRPAWLLLFPRAYPYEFRRSG